MTAALQTISGNVDVCHQVQVTCLTSIRNLFNTSLSSNKLLPNGLAENMEEGKNLSESLGQNSASDVKISSNDLQSNSAAS